jgi:long-subunit acyl-CoA synthetase (AMP-forming)
MATSLVPGTVIGAFLERARERSSDPLWYYQASGRWTPITWVEAHAQVERLAAGFGGIGINRGDRVGLIGANSPQWVVADYALQHVGAVPVPLYPTSAPDQLAHILGKTGARVCVVDSDDLLGRLREVSIPTLEAVVCMHRDEIKGERLIGRETLIEAGKAWSEREPQGLADRLALLGPDDIATVIFTSGTDGDPKGAILTHRNLVWAAQAAAEAVRVKEREIVLSYLPLAHSFERVVTTVVPLVASSKRWTCWFVDEIQKLPSALRAVRPTIFVAVPLVWSRMQSRILAESTRSWLVRRLGSRVARLIGGRVLRRLGLGRCWYAVSGAAPLPEETQRFFQSLGLPLHQGWGLTETAALSTVQTPDDLEVGVVGAPLREVEIRLGIDGEVLVRGPNVFQGYEGDPDLTASAIDVDGFLHTGDVGRLVSEGRLAITDRLKDMIVTIGGRKVAPSAIEAKLTNDRIVAGAMVVGEGRSHLNVLISLDGAEASRVAGSTESSSGLWEHPKVRDRVARTVAAVNRALPDAEQLHDFAILPFGFPDEVMTPSFKLKRRLVEDTFRETIEDLYA